MSRTRNRRPVLSELQRRVIAHELRQHVSSVLPHQRGLDQLVGADVGTVAQDIDIGELITTTAAAKSTAALSQQLDILDAVLDRMKSAAIDAGIPTERFDRLANRLSEAATTTPSPIDAVELTVLTDTVANEFTAIAESVVDALCDARALELAGAAAAEVLRSVGLAEVTVEAIAGELTITGSNGSGQRAELELSASSLVLAVEDPGDAVHPLHPASGEICEGAAELVERINEAIPRAFAEVGLGVGDVEVVDEPTRGSTSLSHRAPAQVRHTSGGAGR